MANLSRANKLAGANGPTTNMSRRRSTFAVSSKRFTPVVAVLENRTLLSQIVVLNNGDTGAGSLRSSIASATPGDVITFAGSLRGQTIALSSPLMIGTSLTIRGFSQGGPTISGSGSTEIMDVSAGATVNLSGLRLINGKAAQGGAIDNAGNLTIRSSALSNNQAIGNAATAGAGGAILNEAGAQLTLLQSKLTGNQAIDNVSSGGTASGGAIMNSPGSSATIRNSTFIGNQAISSQGPSGRGIAGAIGNTSAILAIANSRFTGNSARGFSLGESGAIGNRDGTATITGCVFSNNQAVGTGPGGFAASGAVTNVGAAPFSTTMTIRTSQFIHNQAIASPGGDGVATLSAAFGGAMGTSGAGVVVNVFRSTFTGNQAIAAAPATDSTGNLFAGIAVGGAIENDTSAIFNISSSVIQGNQAKGGSSGANGSGGAAFGGGIGDFMTVATLNLNNTVVTGNSAQGGGGSFGDGAGGGVAVFQNGRGTFSGVTIAGNRAMGAQSSGGGPGSRGIGGALLVGLDQGSGTPGFLFPDSSSVSARRASITGNSALGGIGSQGGNGEGGGIDLAGGTLAVQASVVAANVARGGSGTASGQGGDGFGGGAFAADGTSFTIQTSNIIANLAAGGSIFMGALGGDGIGGGLYIRPAAKVLIDRATPVVANRATTQDNQISGPITVGPN